MQRAANRDRVVYLFTGASMAEYLPCRTMAFGPEWLLIAEVFSPVTEIVHARQQSDVGINICGARGFCHIKYAGQPRALDGHPT